MRKDPLKGEAMKASPAFEASARQAAESLDRSSAGEHSLSGNEPNRFFLNLAGKQFEDLSDLSGMAHLGDGRSVVRWDYDHDGWPDLVSINANAPKLVWYRNQLGDLLTDRHFIALRFEGGNQTAATTPVLSSRDAYGVRIEIDFAGRTLINETRCGEGFSAQHSRTLLMGLGTAQHVDAMTVIWPSGRSQKVGGFSADRLVVVREAPAHGEEPWSVLNY